MISKKTPKVSIYTKSGIRAATTYYRLYQYISKLDCSLEFNKMLSDNMYQKVMPISSKPIYVKGFIFFYCFFRVLWQLIRDVFFFKPNYLIVSRRLINRTLPGVFKSLLLRMKKHGTTLIWDFDDNIILSKEVTQSGFDWMSNVFDIIVVPGEEHVKMITPENRHKIKIMPTTDGDMYQSFTNEVTSKRIEQLDNNLVQIIWVGTSATLDFVKTITPAIDELALKLKPLNKKIIFTVVCNLPLDYNPNHFELKNIKWERDIAIAEMLNSHLGLMPLEDTDITRGKGGFKLIQYLSVGLPVCGSDVGINHQIIDPSVGYCATSLDSQEWANGILSIIESKEKWLKMSDNAFNKWKSEYNFNTNLESWSKIINTTIKYPNN